MKFNYKFSLLFVTTIAFAASAHVIMCKKEFATMQEVTHDFKSILLTDKMQPTNQLADLLKLTNIQHDGTLQSIVTETQKSWLRPANKERWQSEEIFAESHDQIKKLLEEIKFVNAIAPSAQKYKYGLVLGASAVNMTKRFGYLLELWKAGYRFEKLVFLCSSRPVDLTIENIDDLYKASDLGIKFKSKLDTVVQPATEAEMMKFIYNNTDLPQEFKNIPIHLIDVPMLQNADGTLRRAQTVDTIIYWVGTNPTPGSCLFISNQPYVIYQDLAVKDVLPKTFSAETVGKQANENIRNLELLDTVARSLYVINKQLSQATPK